MITHVSTVSVYVTDQDRALGFYVEKLGLEKRRDDPIRRLGKPGDGGRRSRIRTATS